MIYTFWHGTMLPLLWQHRKERVAILISEHGDGEIIARIAHSLGYHSVRGSTSRGGERAILGTARELEGGRDVAFTPDGPRGPRESFAPGALIVSQRTGAPVVLITVDAPRAWRLWLPFGSVAAAMLAVLIWSGYFQRNMPAQASGLDNLDLMTADESLEMMEDIEFYAWLATAAPDSNDIS